MNKQSFFAFILAVLFSSLISGINAAAVTITAAAPSAVTQTAGALVSLNNAIGIDAAIIGRVIPGVSFTHVNDGHTSWSVFGGAVYDGKIFMLFCEANAYYLLNEYFYAGLGISGALDEDGSVIFGFANPTAGFISAITENIKFYAETTVLILTYRIKEGISSNVVVDSPVPVLKLGVRYYF